MSNLETRPPEYVCAETTDDDVELLEPREVPLGGPRAMTVRRTLPQRRRSLIGPWCFADHYGPDRVADTGGMRVPPHPHTGLQTVSWLFTGEIEHRDSAGNHALVRPGELNLMTAGAGISHSEVSTPETDLLHGVQLWTALPERARFTRPRFDHYVPVPVRGPGYELRVFMGELAGAMSPVRTHSPLLGAELCVEAGRTAAFDVDQSFEHGVLVDTGTVRCRGVDVEAGHLAYVPPGTERLSLTTDGAAAARVLLIGGEPLGESIVMWWNFIGRDHDEIVAYRGNWQAGIAAGDATADPGDHAADPGQFGTVAGNTMTPLPAPVMPRVRIRARR